MGTRRSSASERPALGGGWTLWPHVLLRGAGFPFSLLDGVVGAADVSSRLRAVAADPALREAVSWQTPGAVTDGLDWLLRHAREPSNAKARKKEQLVVRYLQRYCAKNDTIGFFGPLGWATWAEGAGRFVPATALVDARRVCLEPWAALALADAAAHGPLRAKALLRVPGDLRLVGAALQTPTQTVPVSAAQAAVLRAVQRAPVPLGRLLAKHPTWATVVDELLAHGALSLGFPVPLAHEPLRAVPRTAAVKRVQALVRELGALPASADRAEHVRALTATLEATFTAATARTARRNAGQTYGARGLVYEDCRRGGALALSEPMRARVARPLATLLQVARWYTFQVARRCAAGVRKRFTALGADAVPLHVLWAQTEALFAGPQPWVVAAPVRELRRRWARVWGSATDASCDALEAPLRRAFAAPCPGWPGARHHAPDLMWAAPSAEAMLRGEGTPVLGELHPGVTPFSTLSVLGLSPMRRALEREWRQDFGDRPRVSQVPTETFARSSHDARLAAAHWHVDLGGAFASARGPDATVRAADVLVRDVRGVLTACHPKFREPLSAVFERRLKLLAAAHFSLDDGAPTAPRRTLDGVVLQRARWRFDRDALAFLQGPEREAGLAQLVQAHGLPRRVFVRSPDEVKPVYVDLDAPVLVEALARLARPAAWLSFSEMLPGPDELWLRDAEGQRYVCELRCIAVDPVPFDAAQVG